MAVERRWNVVKAKVPHKLFGPRQEDIYVRRIHRGPGGQIEQELPRGKPAITLVGQTKAGKSTLANVLVCNNSSFGPFEVGEELESETSYVTTVWSDSCGAFVSDTPGIFENRADEVGAKAVAQRKKRSNDHMRGITYFLNEDGGYVLWVIRNTGLTSQMRGFIRAMRMCDSAWPFHTMIVSTQALSKVLDKIKKEVKNSEPNLKPEKFREKVANEHDRQALRLFNEALEDCGVRFGSFTTFEIDNEFFESKDRVIERIKDFVTQAHHLQLLPGDVTTWGKLLENNERQHKMKAKEIQERSDHLIQKAKAQARIHAEAAKRLQQEASKLSWAYVPLALIPVAGWGMLPFLHREVQQRKAQAEASAQAALSAEEKAKELETHKHEQLKEDLEKYNAEVEEIENLVSESK